jgi:hypothetical protein
MKLSGRYVGAIGSGIAFCGGLVLFKWGPPQPSFQTYIGLALIQSRDIQPQQEKLRRRYQMMSQIGMALVTMGFLIQTVAVVVPDE